MNTREIAAAINKTDRSVLRWAKRAADKMSSIADKMSASTSFHPADYDLDETIAIIETGLGKNAADLFRMSAGKQPLDRLDRIERIVENLVVIVSGIIPQGKPAPVQIVAPIMEPRAELRKCINTIARRDSLDFSEVWKHLYQETYYRLHVNLSARSEHSGKSALDIAEEEGLLGEMLAIAREM